MNAKNTVSMTGAALALAAAGLFASLSTQVVAEEAKVHCYGINGINGCKGHGFKATTLAEYNAAGGKLGE